MFLDDEELKEQRSEHRYKIALIIRYSIEALVLLTALIVAIIIATKS